MQLYGVIRQLRCRVTLTIPLVLCAIGLHLHFSQKYYYHVHVIFISYDQAIVGRPRAHEIHIFNTRVRLFGDSVNTAHFITISRRLESMCHTGIVWVFGVPSMAEQRDGRQEEKQGRMDLDALMAVKLR